MAEKKGAGGKNQPYNEANGEYEKKHRQNRSYSDIPKSEKLKEAIKIYSDDSGKDLYESGKPNRTKGNQGLKKRKDLTDWKQNIIYGTQRKWGSRTPKSTKRRLSSFLTAI